MFQELELKLEKHLSNATFSYWIENFLISRLRAEKYSELANKTISYEDFIEGIKKYGRNI